MPNVCWQADTTHGALTGGAEVETLSITDDHSRLLVASRAFITAKAADVVETFHHVASEPGIPVLHDHRHSLWVGSWVSPLSSGRRREDFGGRRRELQVEPVVRAKLMGISAASIDRPSPTVRPRHRMAIELGHERGQGTFDLTATADVHGLSGSACAQSAGRAAQKRSVPSRPDLGRT
jgi:hypothetical protein